MSSWLGRCEVEYENSSRLHPHAKREDLVLHLLVGRRAARVAAGCVIAVFTASCMPKAIGRIRPGMTEAEVRRIVRISSVCQLHQIWCSQFPPHWINRAAPTADQATRLNRLLARHTDFIVIPEAGDSCRVEYGDAVIGFHRGRVLWIVSGCGEGWTAYDLRPFSDIDRVDLPPAFQP